MDPRLQEAIVTIVLALLPAIAGVVAFYVRAWVRAQEANLRSIVGERNFNIIRDFAQHAVRAAEQIARLETGEQKKSFVLSMMREFARENGIAVSDAQLHGLIEGIVHEVNTEHVIFGTEEQLILPTEEQTAEPGQALQPLN